MNTNRKQAILRITLISLILAVAMLACRVGTPGSETNTNPQTNLIIPTVQLPALPELKLPPVVQDEQALLIALYKRINPSVVNITVYANQGGELMSLGQGSGFIFDTLGHIITNAHVVHGADDIEVSFWDGTIRPAELTGEDLNSDLAVVKVENAPKDALPLSLGNINDVQVGETVVAIGNPFGLDGTLTRGIVSAIGRTIPALTPFSIPKAIQTDAPINPGNSGGPLLNLSGQVIGVNAQIETNGESSSNSGVGFAIPVSIVQRVVPELITNGNYDWAWLGVRGTNLNPVIAQAIKSTIEKGAYITEVIADGPAAKAGLVGSTDIKTVNGRRIPVGGDVITSINNKQVNSFDDLLIYIALETSPGDNVNLTVLRDGQSIDIPLKLEPRPSSLSGEPTPQAP